MNVSVVYKQNHQTHSHSAKLSKIRNIQVSTQKWFNVLKKKLCEKFKNFWRNLNFRFLSLFYLDNSPLIYCFKDIPNLCIHQKFKISYCKFLIFFMASNITSSCSLPMISTRNLIFSCPNYDLSMLIAFSLHILIAQC